MTAIGMVPKKEEFQRVEAVGKGKLIITAKLQGQIDYLHDKIISTEWIGVLLYTKVEGDISDPNTLVLRADKLFLMDIGTAGHTQAIMGGEEVLNMYDQVSDIMELKQGLIHTHHTMDSFFSSEDWSELNDNTPLHNYYLSLIVNYKGAYMAKVAYMADVSNEFKFNNCDDQPVVNTVSRRVMIHVNMDICKESEQVDEAFKDRYDYIKKSKQPKPYVAPVYGGPYHSWKDPKEDQGEVGQKEKTFRREEKPRGQGDPYYRSPSDVLTYSQAKAICLDWLNEGLRMEGSIDKKNTAFVTVNEGLAFFQGYFEGRFDTAQYFSFLNMMQKLLVDASSEYKPSVTTARLKALLREFSYSGDAQTISKDLGEVAEAHPTFLKILRKEQKYDRRKDRRGVEMSQTQISWPQQAQEEVPLYPRGWD